MTRRRARALLVLVTALAGALTAGSSAAARPADVTYWRSLWHHATMYVGPAGKPVIDPGAAVYAIARDVDEEYWVSPTLGARVRYSHDSTPYLPSVADRQAWEHAGSPDLLKLMGTSHYGGYGPTVAPARIDRLLLGSGELYSLLPQGAPFRDMPRSPAAVRTYLQDVAWRQRTVLSNDGDDACRAALADCPAELKQTVRSLALSFALTIVEHPYAPPSLRQALLAMFAAGPGARSLGTLHDRAGRAGQAILLSGDGADGINVVLVDRPRARLVAEATTTTADADHVRWYRVFAVQRATVARLGDRPARR